MSLATRFFPIALLACVACSSSSTPSSSAGNEYDPVFDVAPSGSADASNVVGLWETTKTAESQGVVATSHQRIEIRETTVKLANRCSAEGYETVTVGVTINAQVGDGAITTQDKGGTVTKMSNGPAGKPPIGCQVQLQGPGQLPFALGADKLQIAGASFTKVSD
jgi:hypothetical protein